MKRMLFTVILAILSCTIMLGQSRGEVSKKRQVTRAAGISCGNDPILPVDGSQTIDYVDPGAPNWYLVHLKAGHSYSVEAWDPVDATVNPSTASLVMIASDCSTVLPTTDVTSLDPDLSNTFGARVSWIQQSDASAYVQLNTTDTVGYEYSIRVTDTTLYNSRWSTYNGYKTQYAIWNTTESTITGTLTVTQVIGTACCVTYTQSISIPAGSQQFVVLYAGLGNLQANQSGNATLSFVGPSGGLIADAYFTGPSIVPTSLAPKFTAH
jgi:hypothetical protein